MTKEKLLKAVKLRAFSIDDLLNEFFESNVCIPKGENRHPDADVLHQYIENCTEDFRLVQLDYTLEDWFASDITSEMRFKVEPPELVYEYLYYSRIGNTIWSTKEEAPINMWCAEETKRVRT